MSRQEAVAPSTSAPSKLNAEDYLQQIKLVSDRDAAFNPALSVLFTVVAKVALAVFISFAFLRSCIRQLSYFVARQTVFRNRNPQQVRQDISAFPKIPGHVAFVLESPTGGCTDAFFPSSPSSLSNISALINQSVQCLSWVVGIGARQVTLYERSGVLKKVSPEQLHTALVSGLATQVIAGDLPEVILRIGSSYTYGDGKQSSTRSNEESSNTLLVTLQSEQDGRPMLVGLANEYRKEVAEGAIVPEDITVQKVHNTILERVGDEPDLLVTFGSHVDVEQFSPWLLRVTELFCLPDNNGVFHYMVFYRALEKFAKVKVNLGA